jgi:urocanate hydratase
MYEKYRPKESIKASRGTNLRCKTWDAEAALRLLENNLDEEVALDWKNLVVYGGNGRAARNWLEYQRIKDALLNLEPNETLCVQSGKPVYIAKTYSEAPRVVIANSNLVPHWATQEHFDALDTAGLMMYGQMTAGSWIYIGFQGILQGTYETYAEAGFKDLKVDSLKGKFVLTAGMGNMSAAQPLAATMNGGVILDVEVRKERIERQLKKNHVDKMTESLDEALQWVMKAKEKGEPLSVGLVGNAADIHPKLVKRGIIPDIVTDQTPAHKLELYIPVGDVKEMETLLEENPEEYRKRAYESIKKHAEALLQMQKQGAIVFDYGNNFRERAREAGVPMKTNGVWKYPGFVLQYVRDLFCQGKGPFRWVALSGDENDIFTIDDMILKEFNQDERLCRWIKRAKKEPLFEGLPARVCWLAYGDRARFGTLLNDMVHHGDVTAPVAIGRDHLDCGSVASPNRETEGMIDGTDAVADWPLLNFALNTMCGASWISFHHGGGVGIGYALHAGFVLVADGTKERAKRLERVLTVVPVIGISLHY